MEIGIALLLGLGPVLIYYHFEAKREHEEIMKRLEIERLRACKGCTNRGEK